MGSGQPSTHLPDAGSGSDGRSRRVRWWLAVGAIALSYLAVEATTTALYLAGRLEPASIWMHERTDPAGNVRFDSVRGAWLSPVGARLVCLATNGTIEAQGVYRGNNHGFPDRDDFQPARARLRTRRLAIFGDSFTHAQYLETSWPDRVEDLARGDRVPLELLNLSLDGGGLGNWASVLTRFVEPNDFELDGVVFAVWGEDLRRPFGWWDDRSRGVAGPPERIAFGRAPDWDLEAIPESEGEALGKPQESWYVVSSEQLDRALAGAWRPPFARGWTEPFLWMRARRALAALGGSGGQPDRDVRGPVFGPGQRGLIRAIREALERMALPALVVRVPNRIEDAAWERETERFARRLRARYVDGGGAFAGASRREFASYWLPYDGHWSQSGSDRFAGFMRQVLETWP